MFPNAPGLLGFKNGKFFKPCLMTHVVIIKTKNDPNTYMYDTYKYWEENYINNNKESIK